MRHLLRSMSKARPSPYVVNKRSNSLNSMLNHLHLTLNNPPLQPFNFSHVYLCISYIAVGFLGPYTMSTTRPWRTDELRGHFL